MATKKKRAQKARGKAKPAAPKRKAGARKAKRAAPTKRAVDEAQASEISDFSVHIEVDAPSALGKNDESDDGERDLPGLFAAEARRQKLRQRDNPPAARRPGDDSLFGALGSAASDDEGDED
jgi:hypothetical protein